MRNKGFSMIELCLTLFIVSIFSSVYLMNRTINAFDFYRFPATYLRTQSEAIVESSPKSFHDSYTVEFNENGNVKQARTLQFQQGNIVIELGGGRLVFKK